MIIYVRVQKGEAKRPVAVRHKAETNKREYCFGLNLWRASIRQAWAEFQNAGACQQPLPIAGRDIVPSEPLQRRHRRPSHGHPAAQG
jgi:hypothetical protein